MALAGAVNGQSSRARGGGSVRAETKVQWLGFETLNWGAGTCGSVVLGVTPAVAVTAVTAAGKLRERRQ